MQRIAAALFVIASFVLAAAGARAAPVPKALCLTWQNNLIQGDNMDLDVVLRPAQGTFRTQHVADGPVKYKLYAVHALCWVATPSRWARFRRWPAPRSGARTTSSAS